MKHIIWDFNGTLLNDAQLSVDLDNYVFDRIGVPRITLEDYRNNMTMPVRDFYPLVGVDYDAHSYEEIARIWLDEFNRKAIGVGLLPGALEAIQRMHAQGRSQSVLSASYEPSLKKQCDALGLTPYMMPKRLASDQPRICGISAACRTRAPAKRRRSVGGSCMNWGWLARTWCLWAICWRMPTWQKRWVRTAFWFHGGTTI